MIPFDPRNVADDDTTFRVPAKREADIKSRALCAYFAPEEIVFTPVDPKSCQDGKSTTFYASVSTAVLLNRLDATLGQDGWAVLYETLPQGGVRATLSIRFDPAGEFVSRASVGSGASERVAHTNAFERVCVMWGISRYLYDLPPFGAYYDGSVEGPATRPELPQGCIPSVYRWCGRKEARALMSFMEACLADAKVPQEKWRGAALVLLARYGWTDHTALDKIPVRLARAMRDDLNQWVSDLAKGKTDSPYSPVDMPPAPEPPVTIPWGGPVAPPTAPTPAPAPEPPSQTTAAPATGAGVMPATGKELFGRLLARDTELAKQGRIKAGALLAHVAYAGLANGRTYPVEITRYTGDQIVQAVGWATKFVLEHAPPQPAPDRKK